jgi:microcystin-dependent protein
MSNPYIGEIRMFGGNFPPNGWAFCDGQQMLISENDALFTLIGTTYGGDGQNTFNLPDLRGRVPIHAGTLSGGGVFNLGEMAGVESVTLTTNQLPAHPHSFLVSTGPGNANTPAGNVPGESAAVKIYLEDTPTAAMNAQAIAPAGGSQPHDNMQPYQVISYIISLFGVFPQRS